jgi:nicotinamide-nucleotide amidase
MRSIILSIGDELTLGQTLDTNSQWLSAQLAERSILTIEHRTIADDRHALAKALAECARRCEVIVVTGGLGPTDDDLTREALAEVVTPVEPLVEDAVARDHLRNWFERRGRTMPAMNARQALRPRTFRSMPNPHGTAPGLAGEFGQCRIFCLPGPPREMQPMFLEHVVPSLAAIASDDVLLTASVQEYGMGESVAAQKLGDMMRRDRNPLVGTTASDSIVSARLRARGARAQMQSMLSADIEAVQRLWHPYAFAVNGQTLADSLGDLLVRERLRLATAESCTGGWLGKALVDRAGSSAYYVGGWVVYSNQMKTACLGVAPELIAQHGAVSGEVASAMARGAAVRSGAECALAITGIAGPDGATPGKPVGTVFIAAALREQVQVRRFEFSADRATVRDRAVKGALQMMRLLLIGEAHAPLLWEVARPESSGTLSQEREPDIALLALGSNLGDRRATLESAVQSLRQSPGIQVLDVSGFIETDPVNPSGPPTQERYLNGAVRVRTSLSPQSLLETCLAIEQTHGRSRRATARNAPRTLDIDLLLFGDQVIDQPGLHVPHPRMHERRFVLEPSAEIAADMIHPILRRRLGDLVMEFESAGASSNC